MIPAQIFAQASPLAVFMAEMDLQLKELDDDGNPKVVQCLVIHNCEDPPCLTRILKEMAMGNYLDDLRKDHEEFFRRQVIAAKVQARAPKKKKRKVAKKSRKIRLNGK
jgi:hypothetical protein